MNRFIISKCIEINENDYDGPSVIMSCVSDPSFMLFFPVSKENAKIINYVLKENSKYDINTNILGIYKTMIDSWRSSDRYLAGIIMDTVYSNEAKDEILMIRLALSDQNGEIDSLVHVNFLHAILLSAMEDVTIIISEKLLDKMVPDEDREECHKDIHKPSHNFPEDKKIVDIAKKIMNGKIKDA